jgi:cytochrome b6-f complex iron-sulfur subunit
MQSKIKTMDRKNFLNSLSGGLALTCVSCMMAACEKDSSTPDSGPGGPTPELTIDLSSQLTNVGDFVADANIVVVRIAAGNQTTSFRAFSDVCPHAGGKVAYNKATTGFTCPNHGATFNQSGGVTGGPATTGLKTKSITITGTKLAVCC